MIFNPEESIDFHGFTGPFVQYTYARIQSIIRKITERGSIDHQEALLPLEKEVMFILEQFPSIIASAAEELNPSVVANYVFHLAKTFNSFYTEHSINNAETITKKHLRIQLAMMTANALQNGMQLLGIEVPERM